MPKKKGDVAAQPKSALMVWINERIFRVSFVQKMMFVHNLYIMIKAGLSIVDALRILGAQTENRTLKAAILGIKSQVEKGQPLSEVLTNFPRIFPSIYVAMIAAGEMSGKLETSLLQVGEQMKKSHELTSRIRGALIYPIVVLIAMTLIGIGMVEFVLPKLIGLFADFHAELPLATRILIGVVQFNQKYGAFTLAGFIGLISLCVWLVRKPVVKRQVHAFNLHLPIFGSIIKKINISRFTLTLSSLLSSAIPIIEAVKITAKAQTNLMYREAIDSTADILRKGQPLAEALAVYPKLFPPMVTQMIMVGEQTGEVENMLSELAEYYGNEVDMTMKNFSVIIEPVIILALGLGVGGVAVAVIMPIYSLAQSF